jgi:hypothetical protein
MKILLTIIALITLSCCSEHHCINMAQSDFSKSELQAIQKDMVWIDSVKRAK